MGRSLRWSNAGALARALIVLGLLATDAGAQPAAPARGAALSWVRLEGAEGCIAPVDLAARIEARVGRAVFVRPNDAFVVVEGSVRANTPGGFSAQLSVSDPEGRSYGTRELVVPGGDCRQLDDLVALVIAVTLRGGERGMTLPAEISAQLDALFEDVPAIMAPSELSAQPAAEPAAEVEAEPRPPRQLKPPMTAPQNRFQLGLDAAAMAVTGIQPDGTIGPSVRIRVAVPDVGVAMLAGGLGVAQQHRITDSSSSHDGLLTMTPALASLSLCLPEEPRATLVVSLCARLGVGQLKTTATQFLASNGAQTDLWSELGPEAGLRTPIVRPLYAWLGVSVPIRLSRPEIVYVRSNTQPATAYRMAGLAVLGTLGIGVDLL